MYIVSGRNVNSTYPKGIHLLLTKGVRRPSRNGTVLEVPTPVMTVTRAPLERILYDPGRDANPFFHLYEALWMLAGRNDVESVARFVKRMRDFSDDGVTLGGAYGYRWRYHFDFDQLPIISDRLRSDPDDRRSVLAMWDAGCDLLGQADSSRDVPCNTHVYFKVRDGDRLDATVCCRSNDIIWGLYGANVVHFSFLLEYLALRTGYRVGTLYQLSDSFHGYEEVIAKTPPPEKASNSWYGRGIEPLPLADRPETFEEDLDRVLNGVPPEGKNRLLFAAHDLFEAYYLYKAGDYAAALGKASGAWALDWAVAASHWLKRRKPR